MKTSNIMLFFINLNYIKPIIINTLNTNTSLKSCTSFNLLRIISMNFAAKITLAALISIPSAMTFAAEAKTADLAASEAVVQEAPASESATSDTTAEQAAK